MSSDRPLIPFNQWQALSKLYDGRKFKISNCGLHSDPANCPYLALALHIPAFAYFEQLPDDNRLTNELVYAITSAGIEYVNQHRARFEAQYNRKFSNPDTPCCNYGKGNTEAH